jgi:hypothetical protein
MRLLLLLCLTIASLTGCRIEHHHDHEHHYDKLFPKKTQPAERP